MDIEYLLLLQRFRESINNALTPFMESFSLFAVTYLIMIPVFIYWVVDKRKGLYTLVSYYLCCGFNAMLKLTVCAYRPWIRDARLLPAGDAIRTATGYSFPSGHTTTAGPIYGGLAVSAWSWKKWVRFEHTGFKWPKLLLGVAGLVPLFLMIKYMKPPLDGLLGSHWGHFAYSFIVVLYRIALWPIVIKAVGKGKR